MIDSEIWILTHFCAILSVFLLYLTLHDCYSKKIYFAEARSWFEKAFVYWTWSAFCYSD